MKKIIELHKAILKDYAKNSKKENIEEWLYKEFKRCLPGKRDLELHKMSAEIVDGLKCSDASMEMTAQSDVDEYCKELWFSDEVMKAAG